MSTEQVWHLKLHARDVKLVRLDAGHAIPSWAKRTDPLSSITWTASETSIICPAENVPLGVNQVGPFRIFEIEGPLEFTLIGVLNSLLDPLARASVSVFTLSTFDTDWILVPTEQVEQAVEVFQNSGHTVRRESHPS